MLLLGHQGLPAWSRAGRWGGGAGTCPGGLERSPSTGLILTLSVGMSKAPYDDQASRTTWRPWGGSCVEIGQVFWLELSRPELGAANSPWPLGSGGRSQGQKGSKVGAGESPLCAGFNYRRTHPPERGHAHLSAQQAGAAWAGKHLALRIKGRKQGWRGWWEGPRAHALHPAPTLEHSGPCMAFLGGKGCLLYGQLRVGSRWQEGEKHSWCPGGGGGGALVLGRTTKSEPKTLGSGSAGSVTGSSSPFS